MKNYRKITSLILCFALLCGLMLGASAMPDVPESHWAYETLEKAVELGILKGDAETGNIRPSAPVKRSEFFAMINRAFGYTIAEETPSFTDFAPTAWYANDISVAAAQGYLKGSNGKALPDQTITRAEAMAIIARVMKLAPAEGGTTFVDNAEIPTWFLGELAALQQNGYIQGTGDDLLKPNEKLNRASAATLILGVVGDLINEEGTYVIEAEKNLTITAPGVTIDGGTVGGNMYITEGVGDGDVHINNVSVAGDLMVAGGGINSVYLKGSSVSIIKLASDASYLGHATHVVLNDSKADEIIADANSTTFIESNGAIIATLEIGEGALVMVGGETTIGTVIVENGATIELNDDVKLETIKLAEGASLIVSDGFDLSSIVIQVEDGAAVVVVDEEGEVTIFVAVIDEDGNAALYAQLEDGTLSETPAEIEVTVITEEEVKTSAAPAEEEKKDETPYVPPYIPPSPSVTLTKTNTADIIGEISLPSEVTNITTTSGTAFLADGQVTLYGVTGDQTEAVRALGGLALTYTHNAYVTGNNVRLNFSVTKDGNPTNDAYLLVWNGTNTYELFKTGFMGIYNGQPAAQLSPASTLTFFATTAGTYTITVSAVNASAVTTANADTEKGTAIASTTLQLVVLSTENALAAHKTAQKAAVDTLVTSFRLTESTYTTASWEALQTAISSAKSGIEACQTIAVVKSYNFTTPITSAKNALVTCLNHTATTAGYYKVVYSGTTYYASSTGTLSTDIGTIGLVPIGTVITSRAIPTGTTVIKAAGISNDFVTYYHEASAMPTATNHASRVGNDALELHFPVTSLTANLGAIAINLGNTILGTDLATSNFKLYIKVGSGAAAATDTRYWTSYPDTAFSIGGSVAATGGFAACVLPAGYTVGDSTPVGGWFTVFLDNTDAVNGLTLFIEGNDDIFYVLTISITYFVA